MEASSLPLMFNLVSASAFLFTLFCCLVLSPQIRLYLVKVCGELPKHSTRHFDTLLASTVHAIVAVVLASYSLAFGLLGTYRVFSKSPLGFMTLQMSLGYFVADFLIILVDPKLRSDKGSVAHHITGIVGIITCLYLQGKLMFFIISRLISEASTPFVNMRWVLHELHIADGSLFKTAAYGMLVTFFATRIAIPCHGTGTRRTIALCTLKLPSYLTFSKFGLSVILVCLIYSTSTGSTRWCWG